MKNLCMSNIPVEYLKHERGCYKLNTFDQASKERKNKKKKQGRQIYIFICIKIQQTVLNSNHGHLVKTVTKP